MYTPKKFEVAQNYFPMSRNENNIVKEDYKTDFFKFGEIIWHMLKYLHYIIHYIIRLYNSLENSDVQQKYLGNQLT